MTDEKTSEQLNPDDYAILLALAQVTAGGIEVPLPATADRARVREYVETLGLLPYKLEPAVPGPEVKARLLAEVGDRGAAGTPPAKRSFDEITFAGVAGTDPFDMTFRRPAEPAAVEPPPVESPATEAVEPTAGEPVSADPFRPESETTELRAAEPAAEPAIAEPAWQRPEAESAGPAAVEPVRQEPEADSAGLAAPPFSPAALNAGAGAVPSNVVPIPQAARPATSWWAPALAAMLAFCIVALAYLAGKVREQSQTISQLDGQLQGLPIENLSSFHDEFTRMKQRFYMVTAVARRAYRMKPVQSPGPNVQTAGMVYVCGNHQRWYLNVQGLESPPEGEEYHLWFVTDRGMVDAGVVEVRADASSEMEDQTMPEGTHGFAITRERAGARPDQPSGMMVLLAEESVSL